MAEVLRDRFDALGAKAEELVVLGSLTERFPLALEQPLEGLELRVQAQAVVRAIQDPVEGIRARRAAMPDVSRFDLRARKVLKELEHDEADLRWQVERLGEARISLAQGVRRACEEVTRRGQAAAQALALPARPTLDLQGDDPTPLREALERLRHEASIVARLERCAQRAASTRERLDGVCSALSGAAPGWVGERAAEGVRARYARWERDLPRMGAHGLDQLEHALTFLESRVDLWLGVRTRCVVALGGLDALATAAEQEASGALRGAVRAGVSSASAELTRHAEGGWLFPAGQRAPEHLDALAELHADERVASLVDQVPLWDAWRHAANRWPDAADAERNEFAMAMGALVEARFHLRQPVLLDRFLAGWAEECAQGPWGRGVAARWRREAEAFVEVEQRVWDLELPRALGVVEVQDADPGSLTFQMRLSEATHRWVRDPVLALAPRLPKDIQGRDARPLLEAVLRSATPLPPQSLGARPHELVPVALGELDRIGAASLRALAEQIAPLRAEELEHLLREELRRSTAHRYDADTGIVLRVPTRAVTLDDRARMRLQLERLVEPAEAIRLLRTVGPEGGA